MRKMNLRVRVLAGLFCASLILIGFWVSGYDFNSRGQEAVFCLIASLTGFLFAASCPYLDSREG